jgi:hypothetical protein
MGAGGRVWWVCDREVLAIGKGAGN